MQDNFSSKTTFWTFALIGLLLPFTAFGQKTGITLEDIWASPKFYARGAEEIRWMNDDASYSRLERSKEKTELNIYEVVSGKKTATILDDSKLIDPQTNQPFKVLRYEFSPDENFVLLSTEILPLYRHSSAERIILYDRKNNLIAKLFEGKAVYSPSFSPDGSRIAFVYENNLYQAPLATLAVEQITKDGAKNKVINGMSDWVYEEEFSFSKAYEWSPDSKRIAWLRFDESQVPEYGMDLYGSLYPNRETFKYPKAGEKNAIVQLYIRDIVKKKSLRADIGTETDQYIPRIRWTRNADQVLALRMNRLQNQLDFLLVQASDGKSRVLLQETSKAWVDIHEHMAVQLYFLKDGKNFIWVSEKEGYTHLYQYSLVDGAETRITSGNWDVTDFYGVDEALGFVYFAAADRSPMERHLFRISLTGNSLLSLTTEAGTHSAAFSTGFNYFVHTYSNDTLPTQVTLRTRETASIRILEDNAKLKESLRGIPFHPKTYLTIPGADGTDLNAWMIRPRDFDASRKYPVLMYVYGGPGSQTVKNAWEGPNAFWYQHLADKGYIIVSVDNRGTGNRGSAFKMSTYRQLGKLEAEDQIAAGKWIGQQSWADAERIGIWGWSFGGYVTALCLTKGDGVFKAGISVAPVTNWKFYDTIYTERFLQTPQLNESGYEDNSPVNYAKNLKGRYLLIHGSADDNVHLQNTMDFAQALIRNGKDFEMFVYPDRNHSIYGPGVRIHLYKKMTRFIEENL
jgi:dipeptidyl-peptidase-4